MGHCLDSLILCITPSVFFIEYISEQTGCSPNFLSEELHFVKPVQLEGQSLCHIPKKLQLFSDFCYKNVRTLHFALWKRNTHDTKELTEYASCNE